MRGGKERRTGPRNLCKLNTIINANYCGRQPHTDFRLHSFCQYWGGGRGDGYEKENIAYSYFN